MKGNNKVYLTKMWDHLQMEHGLTPRSFEGSEQQKEHKELHSGDVKSVNQEDADPHWHEGRNICLSALYA